jgi:ParB family chromosome partitioning protein
VAVSNLIRLLDLPDEAIELLERGELTEGHGRALLTVEDHAERRRLARLAAEAGWSVRELEARARGDHEQQKRPRSGPKVVLHPDQEAAVERVTDALESAFGTPVRVRPRGSGFRIELACGTLDEALALAEKVGVRHAA